MSQQAKVTIVDTGCANISSVAFALKRLDCEVEITADKEKIQRAERLVLPGVGSAAHAMQNLKERELISLLKEAKQPLLGICLGMQMLTEFSAEGDADCLGVIPLQVDAMNKDGVRLPHMGWNTLDHIKPHPIMEGIDSLDYCYFVHSFAVRTSHAFLAERGEEAMANTQEYVIAQCTYGEPFAAVIAKDNVIGMQFHPERSGPVGAKLLRNFIELPA